MVQRKPCWVAHFLIKSQKVLGYSQGTSRTLINQLKSINDCILNTCKLASSRLDEYLCFPSSVKRVIPCMNKKRFLKHFSVVLWTHSWIQWHLEHAWTSYQLWDLDWSVEQTAWPMYTYTAAVCKTAPFAIHLNIQCGKTYHLPRQRLGLITPCKSYPQGF